MSKHPSNSTKVDTGKQKGRERLINWLEQSLMIYIYQLARNDAFIRSFRRKWISFLLTTELNDIVEHEIPTAQ